jgi:hypothetical protein
MNRLDVSKTHGNLRWNTLAEVKWCKKLSGTDNTSYGVGVGYHYDL